MRRLNKELPEGLTITACNTADRTSSAAGPKLARYTVTLKEGTFSETELKNFLDKETWPFIKTNRKGRANKIELKSVVKKLTLPSPEKAEIILEDQPGNSVRPTDVLSSVFDLPEEVLKLATIIKGPASISN